MAGGVEFSSGAERGVVDPGVAVDVNGQALVWPNIVEQQLVMIMRITTAQATPAFFGC